MRKSILFVTVLFIIAGLLSGCAASAAAKTFAQEGDSQEVNRTLNVNGVGQVFVTPDLAYVTIGVHTEGKDAAATVQENNAQTQKVIDALKKAGVDPKDIQTTNFNIYPQQQYDNEGKPTGEITYIVDNSVFVTVRDIDEIGDILNAAISAGANSVSGISYDVADREKALSEARDLAVKDAQKQAGELAKSAGVTLGPVQTISSYSSAPPIPVYEGKGGGGVAYDAAQSVPVSPGQMMIRVDVNMVYEIR